MKRTFTKALAAAAIGVGLAFVAPAGATNAIPYFCSGENGPENLGPGIFDVREFSIQDGGEDRRFVTVEAIAAMPRDDAQKFIDRPGDEATFRLWGDDQFDDDLLHTFHPEVYWVDDTGLGMRGGVWTNTWRLDEDAYPEVTNELYVGIRLTDIRNGSEHKVETCMIYWDDELFTFDAPPGPS